MHPRFQSTYDVVIAGAGPVGLFLACELRRFNLSVLVLERAEDPHSPLKRLPFGMRGLSAPTLDAFYRRGLLDGLVAMQAAQQADRANDDPRASAATAHWMQQPRRPAGHFAGIQFFHDDVDPSKWPYRLPSPADTNMAVELDVLETLLAREATTMGAEIRRGFGVDSFLANGAGVSVYANGQTFEGRWLVGCDGGRSTVRKAGGFAFIGTDPEFTGYSIDVELGDPHALRAGRHYTSTGMYTYAQPGTIAMVDFDNGVAHRNQAITLEHVQAVLRRVSCTDVTVKALRLAATWTDRAYQATGYRNARVLLAGDAAHIHSPLGGQGLNLGLGDALNLGWKLASTIRGDAPAGLLDSYQAERHAVGARVLDWSRAQVALMRPTPSTRALEAIVRDLIATRDGATYFAERVWGVSLRYELDEDHPLVGRSMPDFQFVDGSQCGPLLREGKGLLLRFNADVDADVDAQADASLRALASHWQERIVYIDKNVKDRLNLRALLVRPDGFVAWASDETPDLAELARALQRWFGARTTTTAGSA